MSDAATTHGCVRKSAVTAGEEVVPASELADALKQIRELQRLLGKNTVEVEIAPLVDLSLNHNLHAHADLQAASGSAHYLGGQLTAQASSAVARSRSTVEAPIQPDEPFVDPYTQLVHL